MKKYNIKKSAKQLLFLVLFIFVSSNSFSQKSTIVIDLGYRTKFDNTKWGMGSQYKFSLNKNFRIASDFMLYIPEDSDFGLDVGLNIQYVINPVNNLSFYPLVGGIMSNHHFSADGGDRNQSEFGMALGAGAEYYVSRRGFISADWRYHLIDKEKPNWYRDYGVIRLGYGFKF